MKCYQFLQKGILTTQMAKCLVVWRLTAVMEVLVMSLQTLAALPLPGPVKRVAGHSLQTSPVFVSLYHCVSSAKIAVNNYEN